MATAPSSPPTPIPSRLHRARSGAPGLAYPLANLLPITLNTPQTGRTFALNPLSPACRTFQRRPRGHRRQHRHTDRSRDEGAGQANSVPLPDSLFSHFDQTAAWQAIASNGGSGEHVGWGGAVADVIESHEHELELHVHLHLDCRHCTLSLRTNLVPDQLHSGRSHSHLRPGATFVRTPRGTNALNSILSADENNLFAKEYEVVIQRSIEAQAHAGHAMLPAGAGGVPNPPQFLDPMTNKLVDNPLGASLQTVARIIGGKAASALRVRSSTCSSAASTRTMRRPSSMLAC